MSWFKHRTTPHSVAGPSLFKGPFSVAVGPPPSNPSGQKAEPKPAEISRPLGWVPKQSIFG